MAEQTKSTTSALREALPTDELNEEFHRLIQALVGRVLSTATHHVGGLSGKLENFGSGNGSGGEDGSGQSGGMGAMLGKAGEALSEGKSPARAAVSAGAEGIKDKVKNLFKGGGKGGGGKKLKVTNIVESIDIGAPIDVVYKQWTQFSDFPSFMKKVENVEQEDETKTKWKAQVFWSHREWEANIVDQVPQERIVWQSSGQKGHVDGAVTFHELGPNLTRVLVVLEYHPQGLFERTGNLWRAQGRRARLELKHFRRHVTTQAVLHPDELQGWLGEIHDGEVSKSDEDARAEQESAEGDREQEEERGDEQRDQEDQADGQDESAEYEDEDGQDEADDGARDEFDDDEDDLPEEDEQDDEPRDELDEEDYDDEEGDEEDDEDAARDEYDEDAEDAEDEEPQQQPSRRERRPAGAGRR